MPLPGTTWGSRSGGRPPPALIALGLFGVGLALGLGGAGGWLVGAVPAVGGIARWRRVPGGMIAVLVLVAGWSHGRVAQAVDRTRCAARLPAGSVRLRVRAMEPTIAGAPARVRPLAGRCRGTVAARFRASDLILAGDELEVEGRWLPDARPLGAARGTLAVRRWDRVGRHPGLAARLRNHLFATSRRLFGARAGMVDALVLGRRGWIDPAVTASFARAGLVHLLAISGFHVGLIAAWAMLLVRIAGVPRRTARLAGLGVIVAYVGFIGVPAPALRAAIIAVLATGETIRQRKPRTSALFAVTALVLVAIDPWAVAELGAWLSVTALSGATALSRWAASALGRRAVWQLVFGSLGATVATAPVAAYALGVVALIGIPLNLLAIPMAALAVPGVLGALVLAPLSPVAATGLAAGSGALLAGLQWLAERGAGVPGGAVTFDPGLGPALAALGVLVALGWIVGRRNTRAEAARRAGWVVAIVLGLDLAASPSLRSDVGSRLTLHFLSVGQGDAVAIRTPHGHWMLVDAGPRSADRDAGRRVVAPFLIRHGVTALDALILSHAHLDHFGGAPAVLRRIPVGVVMEPGIPTPDPAYRDFLDAVDASGARWTVLRAGTTLAVDGVELRVLHPDTTWSGWGTDLNESSIVLRIRTGRFEALLGGDAGFPVEARLDGQVGDVDLLKVGHHGSATATSVAWLAELRPEVAVVSTGPNRYGHPSPATLERLHEAGVEVWRTDRDGTVSVMVDDTMMRVRSRRGEVALPLH
jgi:competence protein ComEC